MKNLILAALFCLCLFGVSYGQKDKPDKPDKPDREPRMCTMEYPSRCDDRPEPKDKPDPKDRGGPKDKPEPKDRPEIKDRPVWGEFKDRTQFREGREPNFSEFRRKQENRNILD